MIFDGMNGPYPGSLDPDPKYLMFRNRLEKVYRHRSKLARRQGIGCYRLYDRDLPEFPLIIEIYDRYVHVAEYLARHDLAEDAYEQWLDNSLTVIGDVLDVPPERVYCKRRERKSSRQGQYRKLAERRDEDMVTEGGLNFIINLSDYLDTGLFLDHRITRDMVRKEAEGKTFLNLFCYTGSFTVYAAAGGASRTVSIDLSNTYLDWAQRNLKANDIDPATHQYVKGDVLQWLPSLKKDSFDIIMLDPPSFSNSKAMKDYLDIQEDHVGLINLCLEKLTPGGSLYFSTNLRTFRLDSAALRATSIRDITKTTTPFDFEGKLLRWCYLMKK